MDNVSTKSPRSGKGEGNPGNPHSQIPVLHNLGFIFVLMSMVHISYDNTAHFNLFIIKDVGKR